VIPCSTDEPDEDNVRQALRGAVIRWAPYKYYHKKYVENSGENMAVDIGA